MRVRVGLEVLARHLAEVHHRGVDAGAHEIHVERLVKPAQGPSRSRVGGCAGPRHHRGWRPYVDQVSAAGSQHKGDKCAAGVCGREVRCAHHLDDLLGRGLLEEAPHPSTRAVDHQRRRTPGGAHPPRHRHHRTAIGGIQGLGDRLATGGRDLFGQLCKPGGPPRDQHNPPTLGGESSGGRRTDPTRSAGHNGDFVFRFVHEVSLPHPPSKRRMRWCQALGSWEVFTIDLSSMNTRQLPNFLMPGTITIGWVGGGWYPVICSRETPQPRRLRCRVSRRRRSDPRTTRPSASRHECPRSLE